MIVIIHKETAPLVRFVDALMFTSIHNFVGLVTKFSISCHQIWTNTNFLQLSCFSKIWSYRTSDPGSYSLVRCYTVQHAIKYQGVVSNLLPHLQS